MDNKIKIRNAGIEDIPKLVEFRIKLQEHMENSNELILKYKDGWKLKLHDFYQNKISDVTSLVLVAETSDNQIIGMGLASEQSHDDFNIEKSVKIDDVWVEKYYRRKSICKNLILKIIEKYKRKNIHFFALNYVEDNVEAEKTWKQLGFKPVIHYCVNYMGQKEKSWK